MWVKRLCKICDFQQIEDAKHFSLHCLFYSVLRQKLFSAVEHANFDQLSDIDKTIIYYFDEQFTKANSKIY